jgi:hypothetical protein
MTRLFRFAGTAALAAMITAGAAPAMAQPRGWSGGYHGGGWHHRGHDDGLGTFALGAAIVGGIALLANSASKSRARDSGYADRPESGDDRRPARIEDEAADACSAAAEHKYGARVESVDTVQPDGEGFRVEGVVGNGHRFQCGAQGDRVDFVQVEDEASWR